MRNPLHIIWEFIPITFRSDDDVGEVTWSDNIRCEANTELGPELELFEFPVLGQEEDQSRG